MATRTRKPPAPRDISQAAQIEEDDEGEFDAGQSDLSPAQLRAFGHFLFGSDIRRVPRDRIAAAMGEDSDESDEDSDEADEEARFNRLLLEEERLADRDFGNEKPDNDPDSDPDLPVDQFLDKNERNMFYRVLSIVLWSYLQTISDPHRVLVAVDDARFIADDLGIPRGDFDTAMERILGLWPA